MFFIIFYFTFIHFTYKCFIQIHIYFCPLNKNISLNVVIIIIIITTTSTVLLLLLLWQWFNSLNLFNKSNHCIVFLITYLIFVIYCNLLIYKCISYLNDYSLIIIFIWDICVAIWSVHLFDLFVKCKSPSGQCFSGHGWHFLWESDYVLWFVLYHAGHFRWCERRNQIQVRPLLVIVSSSEEWHPALWLWITVLALRNVRVLLLNLVLLDRISSLLSLWACPVSST